MTDRYNDQQLASTWNFRFKEAMVAKAPYTKRWQTYFDAYHGEYFKNENLPDYKSNMVSNYVFSVIETVRPIMLDNNPKFQAMARQPEGMAFSGDLQEVFSYEWDRENMSQKLFRELVNTLVTGTSVFFIPWNSEEKNVKAIPVSPFNIFPDPLATCVEDAEYIIYALYQNVNELKRLFPAQASLLHGGQINYGELVRNNHLNSRIDNQVLVLEVWSRDVDTYVEDEKTGKVTLKYPHGRVITLCPELGVVLDDKANIYADGELPFVLVKDYDLPGKFWGEGEVTQLLSPQKHMNDLSNAIIDNAKSTANMPWIIDKNAGIGVGKITARPGLIIRKNPGSEVRRDQPPSMPMYVVNAVETFKNDIEQISGIYDSIKGNSATGVYTAQGILALQEAGQVRIRLKVKLLEIALGKLGQVWYSRMKQFWKGDRWIQISRQDGSYDMKKFTQNVLKFDYDLKITAGSTMPVNRGAMLDLMIRLAQTPMPDGQPLVDREAVAEYLPEEIKSALLRRAKGQNQNVAQLQQAIQQIGQQLQQLGQENQKNDQQTMGVVQQMTSSIEQLNKQIVQLKQEYDKLEADKKKQDEITQIKTSSYNTGYSDAEKMYKPDESSMMGDIGGAMSSGMGQPQQPVDPTQGAPGHLPDAILNGLQGLSDDELQIILDKNPQLLELLNSQSSTN